MRAGARGGMRGGWDFWGLTQLLTSGRIQRTRHNAVLFTSLGGFAAFPTWELGQEARRGGASLRDW